MGAITSSSVASSGSGYTPGQIVRLAQGSDDGARVVILTVNGSGVPLTLSLPEQGFQTTGAHAGCGYFVQNNVPTTFGGAGSGLTINILAVGPGSDATHGGIFGITVSAGGSGWAVNDTGTLVQGSNSSATYKVTGINTGALVNLSVDSVDGYAIGSVTLVPGGPHPGSGGGATVSVDTISQCAFTPPGGFIIYSAALTP